MNSFSFIFAGTNPLALNCLKLLLEESKNLKFKGVLSRLDAPRGRNLKIQSSAVKAYAQKKGVPVWTPKNTKDPAFLSEISKTKSDFCFVCSYGQILPLAYLQLFSKGSLNLHFSLLPRWRGAAPVEQALMAGDTKTGICLQVMSQELDAGDIIGQRDFKIAKQDNSQDVFSHSLKLAKSLIQQELIKYLKGELVPTPQKHSQKTYAHKIDKKQAQIVWDKPAVTLHNQIRALFLGPQAFCFLKEKRLKIYKAKSLEKQFKGFLPGEICEITKNSLIIACKTGSLKLLEVQKEGRRRQNIQEFLKGCPLKLKEFLR